MEYPMHLLRIRISSQKTIQYSIVVLLVFIYGQIIYRFCIGEFQYPTIRLIIRSHKVSKPRDLHLELYDRSEIWQPPRQQCCGCASQIPKRYDNLSRSQEFTRFYGKTSNGMLKRDTGGFLSWILSAPDCPVFGHMNHTIPIYSETCL